MRNLLSGNIQVGNLEGIGPLGTNLISTNNTAPQRFTDYVTVALYILVFGAGLYATINFVLAGYGYLSAGNDPKKIQDATAKIWQSIVGLLIAAAAVLLAAVVSWILFQDTTVILRPSFIVP